MFHLLNGGIFGIVKKTGTITAVLQALVDEFSNSGPLLTVILMLVISTAGSTLGMGEEFIPLIPVFLFVSYKLGYDKIYGLALVFLSAEIGFAASTTNPFTVQIAQGIAEVPIDSGIRFRLIFYVVILMTSILYLLRYGKKLKADPSNSYLDEGNVYVEDKSARYEKLNMTHTIIVVVSSILFVGILWEVQVRGWWLTEMGAGFLLIVRIPRGSALGFLANIERVYQNA
ncbi:MAG: hypothetical protein GY816_16425, partial [Cytophagales bacterium]|nr:hypothetical protein [Cytophagales bacterium]